MYIPSYSLFYFDKWIIIKLSVLLCCQAANIYPPWPTQYSILLQILSTVTYMFKSKTGTKNTNYHH